MAHEVRAKIDTQAVAHKDLEITIGTSANWTQRCPADDGLSSGGSLGRRISQNKERQTGPL